MSSTTPLRAPGTARQPPRPVWPDWPAPEESGGFPLVASLAPLVAAGAIWAFTRSPYALLFAVAAPLAALGGLLDRRLRRRRRMRRAEARGRETLAALERTVAATRGADARRLEVLGPDPGAERARGTGPPGESAWIRVGRGTLLVTPLLDAPAEVPAALADDVARVAAASERIPDAPVLLPLGSIGVLGPRIPREAVLRFLAVQACARLPAGAAVRVPADAGWAVGLPDAVRAGAGYAFTSGAGTVILDGAADEADLPGGLSAVIRLGDGEPARVETAGVPLEVEDLRIGMLSEAGAAEVVAREAAARGDGGRALPTRVELADLLPGEGSGSASPPGTALATPLGVGADGPVVVDLVRDGPHAIVGGTTGSGKSELLLAWIAGLAAAHPPDEVAFLLVDFKGGSTFDALQPLPHVVGIVSDLDPGTARRATTSLRSEVLRRERALAEAGVRDVADAPGIGRLVVVVDEYAALVEQHPDLHAMIADLAARGRSLGIHLILCTQRPAGVIRDAVLANAGLRISLRVHDPADSRAVVGSDEAAELPAGPPGRAIVRGADGRRRTIQCAVAGPADLTRAVGRGGPAPFRPWAPPLPLRVDAATLATGSTSSDPEAGSSVASAVAFGILDLPDEQRLGTAVWDPATDGNLLVLGGRAAGTTTALGAIAAGCRLRATVVPGSPADAWAVLHETLVQGDAGSDGAVVLVDDVDLLLDGCDEDARPALVRLLAALARELPARGGALVLGAARLPAAASPLLSRIDSRLLLQLPDREQHVLAGGSGGDWSPRRPPGRGWWAGVEVQVAVAADTPAPRVPEVGIEPLDGSPVLGVVCPHPDAVAERIRAAGRTVCGPDDPDPGRPSVRVGDPEEWTDAWSALESVRRTGTLLVVGCTPRDLRTLTRAHSDAPPLDPRRAEGWRIRGRRLDRVRVPWLERT